MKNIYYVSLYIIVTLLCLPFFAQASTKGKEFWYAHVDRSLQYSRGETRCYLYVYSAQPTTVRVEAGTIDWDTTAVVSPGLTAIAIPTDAVNTGAFVVRGEGVHITADDSVSIIAHIGNQVIDQDGPSHKEATLVLPVSSLGYEYYVASSRVNHNLHGYPSTSQFIIVSTENSTEVEITPTDTTVPDYPIGKPFTVVLQRGEMFALRSSPFLKNQWQDTTSDLTGSHIRASAPIAVFGGTFGTTKILRDTTGYALDYAFEQMLPVSMLGREYIVTPVLGTKQSYVCRIFAMYDSTELQINNAIPSQLQKGEMYDIETREALYVHSTKPVSVYQYIQNISNVVSEAYDTLNFIGSGYVAIQPLEQMSIRHAIIPDVPFNRPYRQTFLNLVVKSTDLISPIEVDGSLINDKFIPLPSNPEYSYVQLRLPYGHTVHSVTALEPFIGYAYGTGWVYDWTPSAVYFHNLGGGGVNLLLTADADADTVCPDSLVNFQGRLSMSLDTAGAEWLWEFGDGEQAMGERVQHRYQTEGIYRVTLRIRKGTFLVADPVHLTVTVARGLVVSDVERLDFGVISPCQSSVQELVVDLSNQGVVDAVVSSASWSSSEGLFRILSSVSHLGVGASGRLRIGFQSSGAVGVWRDTLLLQVEPCGKSITIAMSAEVLPGSLSAESVEIGVLSGCSPVQKDTVIVVRNTSVRSITLTGATSSLGYSVLNLSTPVELLSGESYDISVRFSPPVVGVYSGVVRIAYEYADCRDTLGVVISGELRGEPIVVESGGDTSVCRGGSAALWAAGGVSYQWSPSEGLDDATSATPVAHPAQTTAYTVVVANQSGCTGSSVVVVTVLSPPTLTVLDAMSVCAGGSVQLRAEGAERYQWSPSTGLDDPRSATPTATPESTMSYMVRGFTGECSTTASVQVEVFALPVVAVSADTVVCLGETVSLVAGSSEGAAYRWSPAVGLDNPFSPVVRASPIESTAYTVEVVDKNGCSSTASVFVEVLMPVSASVVVPDVVESGRRFTIPIRLESAPDVLPIENLHIVVWVDYPSRMMAVESVSGAVLLGDERLDGETRRVKLEIGSLRVDRPGQDVCFLDCRALLSTQSDGIVFPSSVEVVSGRCVEPDTRGGGLQVSGFCQGTDLRRFQPLKVGVFSGAEEATVIVESSESGLYTAELYSVYGQLLERRYLPVEDGAFRISLSTTHYARGLYMIRVSGMQQSQSFPLLIGR